MLVGRLAMAGEPGACAKGGPGFLGRLSGLSHGRTECALPWPALAAPLRDLALAASMRSSRVVPPQALRAPACWSIFGGARRRWRTWASSSPARSCSKGRGEPPPPQSATHCCTSHKRCALPAWLRGREQEGQARAAALSPCARSAPPVPPVMQVGHRLGGPLHGQRPGPVLGSGRQERQRRLLISSGAARQRNGWRQAMRSCFGGGSWPSCCCVQ